MALQRLASTFKQPVERFSVLVPGSRTVVKRGADIALAAKLQTAIEAAGCDCVVEPELIDLSLDVAGEPLPSVSGTMVAADDNAPLPVPNPQAEIPPDAAAGKTASELRRRLGVAGEAVGDVVKELASQAKSADYAGMRDRSVDGAKAVGAELKDLASQAKAGRWADVRGRFRQRRYVIGSLVAVGALALCVSLLMPNGSPSYDRLVGTWQCPDQQTTYTQSGKISIVFDASASHGDFTLRGDELETHITRFTFDPPLFIPGRGRVSVTNANAMAVQKIAIHGSTLSMRGIGWTNGNGKWVTAGGDQPAKLRSCTRL